jgi:outer membrane protein
LPLTLPAAVEFSLIQNPSVTAAMFGIEINFLQVKVAEGALLPTVTLQAAVQQSYEQTITVNRSFGAAAISQLAVPEEPFGSRARRPFPKIRPSY